MPSVLLALGQVLVGGQHLDVALQHPPQLAAGSASAAGLPMVEHPGSRAAWAGLSRGGGARVEDTGEVAALSTALGSGRAPTSCSRRGGGWLPRPGASLVAECWAKTPRPLSNWDLVGHWWQMVGGCDPSNRP